MSKRKFNSLSYMFDKAYFNIEFVKVNPQCKDCEEVNSIAFGRIHFHKIMRDKICLKCPQYDELKFDVFSLGEEQVLTISD